MKILQLVTKRQHRGAELSAWNLSRVLLANGHEIVWLGLYQVTDDELTLQGAANLDLPGVKKSFLDFNKVKALKKIIRDNNIDIIQANGAETLKYAAAATIFKRRPPIVYRNISLVSFWMKNSLPKKILNGFLFSKAAHVVSVGQNAKDDLISVFPKLKNKASVISRGVPLVEVGKTAAKQKVIEEFNLKQETKILLWVGALSKEKNPLFIVEVMHEVVQQNQNTVLIMAGKGSMHNDIKNKIEQAGLQKHVILAGYRNDLPQLNAAADMMLLGSFIEGVPGVILEAGLQSTPCVAVNVGGVKEVVDDNVTGVLIDKHVVSEFSKFIIELLNDEHKRKRMGENAKQFVLTHYNEVKNTAKFESLYESLIKK